MKTKFLLFLAALAAIGLALVIVLEERSALVAHWQLPMRDASWDGLMRALQRNAR